MDDRRRNLQYFKDGDIRFLICTDVGARGLDIKELPYVVSEPPAGGQFLTTKT